MLTFHKQETPYSCAPACLRMVLESFGIKKSEAELRILCDCTPLGTEALKVVDAAYQLGLTNTVKCNLTMDELASQIDAGIYPIVYINLLPIDGYKDAHAMVVAAVDEVRVRVYDPLKGEREILRPEFEQAWAIMRSLSILIMN